MVRSDLNCSASERMISALDTSVILDVLVANNPFCDSSIQAIRKARSEGKLIVGECVVAEIFPTLENEEAITELMLDWQIHFVPLSLEGAMLASKHFSSYLDYFEDLELVDPSSD